MTELNAARERTDAKLRYAGVHLDELQMIRRGGSDFDAAHEESFMFHLFGVRDALLQEINIFHSCGLPIDKITLQRLQKALSDANTSSPALDALSALEKDPNSWLKSLGEMRHHSTHRRNVPRLYHLGGENDGKVFLTDTGRGDIIEEDFVTLFDKWFRKMKKLVEDLRAKMTGAKNG